MVCNRLYEVKLKIVNIRDGNDSIIVNLMNY